MVRSADSRIFDDQFSPTCPPRNSKSFFREKAQKPFQQTPCCENRVTTTFAIAPITEKTQMGVRGGAQWSFLLKKT
jgi:hypothetical protein